MTFLHHVARRQPATLLEIIALLVNSLVFFGLGYGLVYDAYGRDWCAILTLAMTVFYTAHVYSFLIRHQRDRALFLTFMSLAAFFLTITAPILLSRAWITPTWAVQALIMLWLARRLDSAFLRNLACVIYAIMLWRFGFIDLQVQYAAAAGASRPFGAYLSDLLERLIVLGVPVASVAGAALLLRRGPQTFRETTVKSNDLPAWLPHQQMVIGLFTLGLGMLFLFLHLEFNRSFGLLYAPLRLPMLTALWVGLGVVLLHLHRRTGSQSLYWLLLGCVAAILFKLLFFDLRSWDLTLQAAGALEAPLYGGPYRLIHLCMRVLDFALLGGFAMYAASVMGGHGDNDERRDAAPAFRWLALALLFLFTTLETNTVLAEFVPGLRSGGVSILWSLFALALVFVGIRRNQGALRYSGLFLFAVVVWRIFMVDLRQLDPIYRIVAFIALGIVVLSASLAYLSYRHVFTTGADDSNSTNDTGH